MKQDEVIKGLTKILNAAKKNKIKHFGIGAGKSVKSSVTNIDRISATIFEYEKGLSK